MAEKWSKEQYIEWVQRRDEDPANWSIADCRKADQHAEAVSLVALDKKLDELAVSAPIKEFIMTCAWAHFGSVETDALLSKLDCYPDYIKEAQK